MDLASSIAPVTLPDIKPQTEVAALLRDKYAAIQETFPIERVGTCQRL